MLHRTQILIRTLTLAAVFAAAFTVPVWAAGKHAGGHHHGPAIGEPAKPAAATRTIHIEMIDTAFAPKTISVTKGEIVRFVVVNKGELVHEFNIGTAAMHAKHQEEMMAMADQGILEADRINHHMMKSGAGHGHGKGHVMTHDDPNSVLLEPGKSGEIVWRFSVAADLQMACNVPGHYEAGMVGSIRFN